MTNSKIATMPKEQLELFLKSAQTDLDLQGRISHASDIDEIEAIAKQSRFSVSTSDLEDWHDHDESSDGFKEDLHMLIQLYMWRGIGKRCDPEWMQAAKRRERRRELGLD